MSNIPLKPEFVPIKISDIDINLSKKIFDSNYDIYYIPKMKYFIVKYEGVNQKLELFLYNYNFNLLDKFEEKYLKFNILKISDDIDNNYYDFVVDSLNEKRIENLLFYKIINSKFFINYKIFINLYIFFYQSYQLNILFKKNFILIIYEKNNSIGTGRKYKRLSYELIQNKFQKMNEILLDNKNKKDYTRISFIYIPLYNSIFFNCYDDDDDDLYMLYNLKTYKIELIDNSMKKKLKNISNKNEDILLDKGNDINELKQFNLIRGKIDEYWTNERRCCYVMSKKKINKSLYVIIYDKLNLVYLYEIINDNIKLAKICNLNLSIEINNIEILDEDRFIILYYENGNNDIKSMICTFL